MNIKRKWVKIAGIMLVVVLIACSIILGLFYWRAKQSILAERGIWNTFGIEKVFLCQGGGTAEGSLSKGDRRKLFMILLHTSRYDKEKDKPYLLDGAFLQGPSISFGDEPFGQEDMISWRNQEGIFIYYPDASPKHSCEYYLEKKYAQELKALFDKYTDTY